MSHTHPMTVTVAVPTAEALHELSIFLQEFHRKHHGATPHHASFVKETAPEVHYHEPKVLQQDQPKVQQHSVYAPQPQQPTYAPQPQQPTYAPQPQQAPSAPAVTFDDVVKLQKSLIENRVVTTGQIAALYGQLGINIAQGVQAHQLAPLFNALGEFQTARQ